MYFICLNVKGHHLIESRHDGSYVLARYCFFLSHGSTHLFVQKQETRLDCFLRRTYLSSLHDIMLRLCIFAMRGHYVYGVLLRQGF